jgi:hypothetical protein
MTQLSWRASNSPLRWLSILFWRGSSATMEISKPLIFLSAADEHVAPLTVKIASCGACEGGKRPLKWTPFVMRSIPAASSSSANLSLNQTDLAGCDRLLIPLDAYAWRLWDVNLPVADFEVPLQDRVAPIQPFQ